MKRYLDIRPCVLLYILLSVVIIVDLDLPTQTLCLSVRGNAGVESMVVR